MSEAKAWTQTQTDALAKELLAMIRVRGGEVIWPAKATKRLHQVITQEAQQGR